MLPAWHCEGLGGWVAGGVCGEVTGGEIAFKNQYSACCCQWTSCPLAWHVEHHNIWWTQCTTVVMTVTTCSDYVGWRRQAASHIGNCQYEYCNVGIARQTMIVFGMTHATVAVAR